MSECEAGPGCGIDCTFGCGCISRPDGSRCTCQCYDRDGVGTLGLAVWGLDEPVSLCLRDVRASALAEEIATVFAEEVLRREEIISERLFMKSPSTTLRQVAGEVGITFRPA